MGLYLISYDISKTKLRNQLAKILEGYGIRVQYSVFECELDKEHYQSLYQKLSKVVLDQNTDSIRIYHICAKCEKESIVLGNQKKGIRQLTDSTIVINLWRKTHMLACGMKATFLSLDINIE